VQTYRGGNHAWVLDPDLVERLRELARRERTTLFTVLLAGYQAALHRWTGQDDLIVGTTTAGRARPEWDNVVGYFLNQVPLRADLSQSPSFVQLLAQTRTRFLEAMGHEDFPFPLLVERLQPARDPSRSPLFQTMFIWDKPRDLAADEPAGGLDLRPILMEQRGAPFDLTWIIFEKGGRLEAILRYNADLFDAATVARMAGHLNTLLAAAVAEPDRPVAELSLLTDAECRQVLLDWNDTRCDLPDECFHQVFEAKAAANPDAPAICFENQQLSYGELNRRANQLAHRLRRLGAGPGALVGIFAERSPEMVIAVLAAWKAGAAYVPLDPIFPAKRLAGILDDARPALLLTQSGLREKLPGTAIPLLLLDTDWPAVAEESGDNLEPPSGDALAYVIYTSGSTGQPKGTLLRHRGLRNLFLAQQRVYDLGPGDRVLQFASLTFDASVFETTMALGTGAALVLAPHARLLPGPGLLHLLRERAVTCVTLPPSVLALLPREELPALRLITVAGEACPAEVVDAWAPGRTFFNAYGPTEATVWSTIVRCMPGTGAPTIGRPIANSRCYLLDSHLQPVPVGVPGELHLAGPGLALGYANRPELTAQKFIPNPFDADDGGVLYKTGDLARWRPDGEIEFLGRIDYQVKVRGYRIEPGEIEAALRQAPGVREAVVVADGNGSAARLVAYVVADSGVSLSPQEVRSFLREQLPHYMLPAAMVPLPELPLTPNGKIDRARLPRPDAGAGASRTSAPPRTPAEKALADIWSKVLSVRGVGVDDNFFDLGGASIQTVEVADEAQKAGLAVTPEMIFRHQTIAELAAVCQPAPAVEAIPEKRPAAPAALPVPAAAPASAAAVQTARMVIESLGVYLPPKEVSTAEVARGCRVPLTFPLERMTGIQARRMAGEDEFALDLAERAVADCLSRSGFAATDVDLLICCNISRCNGPDNRFDYEPTTAARLRHRFGFANALAFDLTNACAGLFTGLAVAESYLKAGLARRALLVSGEHISHLTRTAQREIEGFMDPRLACLTLGDAGVALTVELSDAGPGFHELSMFTMSRYSGLCVARATDGPHGGAVMYTDSVKSANVTIGQSVRHALRALERHQWPPEKVDHLILHQTSETTLDGAVREINKITGQTVTHRGNVIYNVAERGNTATTSHWVALMDHIRAGRIRSGDKVLFGITGSGITLGTALYTLDDLPDRITNRFTAENAESAERRKREKKEGASESRPTMSSGSLSSLSSLSSSSALSASSAVNRLPRLRVAGVGLTPDEGPRETLAMLRSAAEACLQDAEARPGDVELVLHAGVYRTGHLSEPALAALVANDLKINPEADAAADRQTFAFDVMNGGAGFLNAVHTAATMIAAGRHRNALVLASEVENNATAWPENLLGLKETASAVLLEESAADGEGFGAFLFRSFPEHLGRLETHTVTRNGKSALHVERDPALHAACAECAAAAVRELLEREGRRIEDIKAVFPPHVSAAFVAELAKALGVPAERMVTLPDGEHDYFTSSFAHAFRAARERNLVGPGDVGLVINVGAGVEVGCALYHFGKESL